MPAPRASDPLARAAPRRVAALGLVAAALGVRLLTARFELPYYSLDENEVVEVALSHLFGDLDPRIYGYGSLVSYLLAAVVRVYLALGALFAGWTPADWEHRLFFDQGSLFWLGRCLHGFAGLAAGLVGFQFARRHFDSPTAWAALVIGSAPLLELNTEYTVRTDTFQGLFALAALYFAADLEARRALRGYVLTGVFTGLTLACKPVPSLTLLPVLALAHVLAGPSAGQDGGWRARARRLVSRELWVLLGVALVTHTVVNPYSALEARAFLAGNFGSVSGGGNTGAGRLLWTFFPHWSRIWGPPFLVAAGAALAYSLKARSRPSTLLLAYVAVYCGPFLFVAGRTYWFNAVLPAVMLLTARGAAALAGWLTQQRTARHAPAAALAAAALALLPCRSSATLAWREATQGASVERRADRVAQRWIETNLPPHSRVLLVGWYPWSLPRILADDPQVQAGWGEYFAYGRGDKPTWVAAFHRAYARLASSDRPRYALDNIRTHYSGLAAEPEHSEVFFELDRVASERGARYVVTGSLNGFTGPWETSNRVALLARFRRPPGSTGPLEVKVFALR